MTLAKLSQHINHINVKFVTPQGNLWACWTCATRQCQNGLSKSSCTTGVTQNAVDKVGWKGGMEMMLVLARACFCVWTCKASQLRTACWKPSTNPVDGELVAQLSENPASDTSLVPRINSGTHADAVKTQKQNIKALSQSHSISSDSISPLSFLHRWSRCKSAIIPLTDWHSRLPKYGVWFPCKKNI